jgi:ABC-2 type transport system permease protein
MNRIMLVARRDFLAYVGSWGFWLSLLTAPLIIAALIFGPLLLARAEPPRTIAVLADRAEDAEAVRAAFVDLARREARGEIGAYLRAAAPALTQEALAAFDAAPSREAAIAITRNLVAERAPNALPAFPAPHPRYLLTDPPSPSIEALRPYLDGQRTLGDGRSLYGALVIKRTEAATPRIEYWSVNLNQVEASDIARSALRLEMQRDALVASGLERAEADRLNGFAPEVAQYDPRPGAGDEQVTLRDRAPFFAALALAFILWSVVFSVANMLLTGVIEEKSNKILDTLLTSVTPLEMLIGKLLGVAAVSATLFLFWGALGGGLLTMAANNMSQSIVGQVASAFLEPRLLVAFAIGFVAGYLMYGAIFLALGSLCDSMQEAQTLLGPVALVLALPMMLITPAIDNPNAPIIETASWIPLFTPFLLLIRAPSGLSWTEIAGQGALTVFTLALVVLIAARIFRAGVSNQTSVSSLMGRKKA